MISNHIKSGWRNIIKNRLTSLINIAGLSVAMAAVIMIVIWVQNELRMKC